MSKEAYDELMVFASKGNLLTGVIELMDWDKQVMMPKGGADLRSRQLGLMAELAHENALNPRIGGLLDSVDLSLLSYDEKRNVEEIRFSYERSKNVPTKLAREFAETTAKAHEVWAEAREKNDFSLFAPYLQKIIDLSLDQAKAIDSSKDPYAVLFEEYEKEMSLEYVSDMFSKAREEIVSILSGINDDTSTSVLFEDVDLDVQHEINEEIAKAIGYDFNLGRLDVSTHPFTAADSRITTRYDTGWFFGISATMHEAGHGIYEQNIPRDKLEEPIGVFCSLSVHESQSRFWENAIGKSKEFWSYYFPTLQKKFSPHLDNYDLDKFYHVINKVERSLIRVDADELTYVLHIILRFEMEKDLISGKLKVEDVPKRWNERMQEYIGIVPDSDSKGCLQDVHWSSGIFGYFPTYALGSFLYAQLYYKMREDLPNFDDLVSSGNFKDIFNWLKENIHVHGRRYDTLELIKRATGKDFGCDDYIRYLKEKFGSLYSV